MASEFQTLTDIERSNSLNPVQKTRLDELRRTQGSSSPDAGLPDLQGTVGGQREAGKNLLQNQQAANNDFLSRYRSAIGGQESVGAMAGRIGQELGLPTLNKNAFDLNQQLFDLPQTLIQGTKGDDVNANQLARMTSQQQSVLSPLAQRATAQAQFAQDQLGQRMGYEQEQQSKELSPYSTEQGMLADRQAREMSMFSTQNQQELDGLIAKMQANIQLTEGEKNRAQALALSEQDYTLKREQINQSNNSNDKRYITLANGSGLYDTVSGKMIAQGGKFGVGSGTSARPASAYAPTRSTSTSGNWTVSGSSSTSKYGYR